MDIDHLPDWPELHEQCDGVPPMPRVASTLVMDTDHLLDWPELAEVADGVDEAGEEGESSYGFVVRVARRHTLRSRRVDVEVAIRVNRAAVQRQRRVFEALVPTGSTSPVLATLEVAPVRAGGGSRGVHARTLGRESGVWRDCRDGVRAAGTAASAVGAQSFDGGAALVNNGVGMTRHVGSEGHIAEEGSGCRVGSSGGPGVRHAPDDVLGRLCACPVTSGINEDGSTGRPPPPKLRRLSTHGRWGRDGRDAASGGRASLGTRFGWESEVGPRDRCSLPPPGSVRVTVLSAEEQLPTHTFYVPVRHSWRRVEKAPGRRFVPYMRDKTGPFAESARAALLDRWAFRDDSDDSDASDDEGERRGAEYYRLPARMRRHAARAGVSAAVGMFGQGPVVVAAIAASLGWSTAAVTRCVALIERRARENAALRWERSARIARRQAVERLTGGASLALVLGSGAVKVSSMSQGVRRIAAGLGRVESPPSRWSIARVTADAHVDVAAAGLPAASRRWAVRQALRVAAELEVDDWTRADLHALRALGAELRSSDAVACAQERTGNALPIVGPKAVAAAGEEAGSGAHQAMEASTLGSDTLSRLLCRVCLRYACRLHSTNSLHPLSAPPPPRPVRPPPDPSRLPNGVDNPYDREAAAAASIALDSDSDSGESSDGDVSSLPTQAAVRRGRSASALHRSIAVAASTCSDCRHSHVLRPAGDDGHVAPAVGAWTEEQVTLLRLGGAVVGRRDTCWLARFVPGQTCRGVAAYTDAEGWPDEDCAAVVPPLKDAWDSYGCSSRPGESSGLSQAASAQLPRQQGLSASPAAGASSQGVGRAVDFVPCFHQGRCTVGVCRCVRADIPCEKYCGCARLRWVSADPACVPEPPPFASIPAPGSRLCPRRVWCECAAPGRCATDDCPCFAADRECDPDACSSCGAHWHPSTGIDRVHLAGDSSGGCSATPAAAGVGVLEEDDAASGSVAGSRRCRNVQLQVGLRVRLVLGRSEAHGFGVFAAERACKGDFVGEYVGEMVPHDDAHARGRVYDSFGVSYLYTLTRAVVLDACRVGSRMRYVNHSRKNANLQPKLLSVCGYIRVGLFALRDLTLGEELLFDYGYEEDGWRE